MIHNDSRALSKDEIRALLAEARNRTFSLLAPLVDEEELRVQHSPLMSPILWDLGHIGHFEEVWLVENVRSGDTGEEGLRGIYNPFENPRATRNQIGLPSLDECLAFMGGVRRSVLEALEELDLDSPAPLLRDGFVFRMVLQHEYQHNETILQTLQLKQGAPYRARPFASAPVNSRSADFSRDEMVRFPGGTVQIGTDDLGAAYDNERPRHPIELAPFWIDATPVTNGAYMEFLESGGYERPEYWSEAGWQWVQETGAVAPEYWYEADGEWRVRSMSGEISPDPAHPVCHVCYHEAEAFARFSGKRLPTEFEWEAAAGWDLDRGVQLQYPWGDEPPTATKVNLDALYFGTAPVWAYSENISPLGCYGMIGDVWEWTSTDFNGYPGYDTFPYPEYSEVFFGTEYKVLRGGSWATRFGAVRNSFRNWDYPIRRQIFSGFRCAKDDT